MEDVADRRVGFMIRDFQLARGSGVAVGLVVKEAVGKGTTQSLVKKYKGESDLGPLVGEPIGIVFAIPLDQTMRLHLAEIVTELV